ncbi:phosphonate C-P lyase system protein PhnH [Mariprofundus sp. EBB-1]|uniref:phosphonate C-P lyase system protein PhnH n=1 Tax=Mariprofundus sp. EBB-1 TaxID=2650971 RepID=UPI0019142DDE|nr:phosphonate C-P lyase system protein PhnH [Mariprofundus sp. EBB-1]
MKIDAIWQPDKQQQMFRVLLEAMSRPGSIQSLPAALQSSMADKALLATLLDGEVSMCDRHALLTTSDWPLLQARQADAEQADYILCDGAQAPDFEPRLGTLSCPDESATLIIKVRSLYGGDMGLKLEGPGIEASTRVVIDGLHPDWLKTRQDWVCSFPLGVDCLFVDESHVIGLPRTTIVEVC